MNVYISCHCYNFAQFHSALKDIEFCNVYTESIVVCSCLYKGKELVAYLNAHSKCKMNLVCSLGSRIVRVMRNYALSPTAPGNIFYQWKCAPG